MAPKTDGSLAEALVAGVVQLAQASEDKREALEVVLGLLARETDGSLARALVAGVVQLAQASEDKREALEVDFVCWLARPTAPGQSVGGPGTA